jgi:hypothetical protein
MTRAPVLAIVAACVLAFAGSAYAVTFTSSQITTPGDNTFFQDVVGASTTLHVVGTTSGGGGPMDLVCFYGTDMKVLSSGIPVSGNAFDVNVPTSSFSNAAPRPYCQLRAVPNGDVTDYPPGASSFAGPRIGFGQIEEDYTISGGPNDGATYDYFVAQGQSQGYMDFLSMGGGGLDYSFVFDPVTFAQSNPLFDFNGATFQANGCTPSSLTCDGPTRSEVQVDNANAYTPDGQSNLYNDGGSNRSDQLEGFTPLKFTRMIDPLNGAIHTTETDPLVKCTPSPTAFHASQVDPAWKTDCTSFSPTGITVNRTTTGDQNGRHASITDVWNNTDPQPHDVDVLYDEQFVGDSGSTPNISYEYPWIDNLFHAANKGDNVTGPTAPGPATVFVDGNGPTADTFAFPQGAVTVNPAPKDIHWYGQDSYSTWHYTFTVPANGSVTIKQDYLQGSSKDEVTAKAATARDQLGTPTVAITSPVNGSTSPTAAITVSGTSSDPGGGVTGVTVNGAAATLAGDGSWTAPVTLTPGSNTITASAGDAAGNTGTASETVTFTPPPATTTTPNGDRTPPILGLLVGNVKLAKLLANGLPATVSSNEPISFNVTVGIDAKAGRAVGLAAKLLVVGTKSGVLTTAGRKKITIKLLKKAKKALRHARKVKLTVKLAAKDTAGNAASKTKTVTIKR